jgi:hypothetical protein
LQLLGILQKLPQSFARKFLSPIVVFSNRFLPILVITIGLLSFVGFFLLTSPFYKLFVLEIQGKGLRFELVHHALNNQGITKGFFFNTWFDLHLFN